MILLPTTLVVGASSRNCGKTTFICELLDRFAAYKPIAVKIKTVYPGDDRWHGKGGKLTSPFIIREETVTTGMEDSVRFLQAGAEKVYYIKSHANSLTEAIQLFLKMIPKSRPLIFESNSVRDCIEPSVFLMIIGSTIKPSAKRLKSLVDRTIDTDGAKHNPAPSALNLSWTGEGWRLD